VLFVIAELLVLIKFRIVCKIRIRFVAQTDVTTVQ